ncbi:MAG: helix-turn-helix transcriptional regulator [Acholeplasmataceae bacterium]|nr:helix-turn-helix transcriptional regulator [Acholeplasmataceae bacterium]
MGLGNKIMDLRKSKRLSQEDLANKIGVTRQSISLWETNQSMPSTEKLLELAKCFDISIDNLISDMVNEKADRIIIRSVHSKESYETLISETTSFFQRHLQKGVSLFLIVIISIFVGNLFYENDPIFYIVNFSIIFLIMLPLIIYLSSKFEHKRSKFILDYTKENFQEFIFKDEFLTVKFKNEEAEVESKLDYKIFKKVLISNNYIYFESPRERRKFFQMDLKNFIQGDKINLLNFLHEKGVDIKDVSSKSVNLIEGNQKTSKLYGNKTLYFCLLFSIVTQVLLMGVLITSYIEAFEELISYQSTRISLQDMNIFLLLLIPLTLLIMFTIFLSIKRFKSWLIILSYLISPIILLVVLGLSVVFPSMHENRYNKDFDRVIAIFDSANTYIPAEGLVVSERQYIITEENLSILPYTEKHKILLTNDITIFESTLLSSNNWLEDKTPAMKAKLNIFIDINSDYYLIYNETASNFNDDVLLEGLNKLYLFCYSIESNEIIVYEFYIYY